MSYFKNYYFTSGVYTPPVKVTLSCSEVMIVAEAGNELSNHHAMQ